MLDWKRPPTNFSYILFDRPLPDEQQQQQRFYLLSWQASLIDDQAVVRVYGQKDGWQKVLVTPFDSLEEAWPLIRRLISRRLRKGYRIVEPVSWAQRPRVEPLSWAQPSLFDLD